MEPRVPGWIDAHFPVAELRLAVVGETALGFLAACDAATRVLVTGTLVPEAATAAAVRPDAVEQLRSAHAVAVGWFPGRDQLLLELARLGKHLLVEPPFAAADGELEQLLTVCAKSGAVLIPAYRRRFAPAPRVVCSAVRAGELGRVGLIRQHRVCASLVHTPLAALLIDEIDLTMTLMGGAPETTYAAAQGSQAVVTHLGFPEGGMAIINISRQLPTGAGYGSLLVVGSEGAAYDDVTANVHVRFGPEVPEAVLARPDGDEHLTLLAVLARAAAGESPPPITVEDHLQAARMTAGALASADRGTALAGGAG